MNKYTEKNIATIVSIIIAFFIGAIGMYVTMYFLPINESQTQTKREVTVNEQGIADAVEKVYDAVVTVQTYRENKHVASGTGFVYKVENNKAYILTNNHVINNSDEIYLIFTNGEKIKAEILGSDLFADIAVLQVDEKDIISVAEIGSSEKAKIGDTVFAVGAPIDIGFSWTVTRGIVSGKDRMVEVSVGGGQRSDWIMRVIQTDASINRGNSGGPLANSNGEVIGVNTLKIGNEGVEGMGFAIPIEDALYYADKLAKGQTLTRPFLGISMLDIRDTGALRASNINIPDNITRGVVIVEISEGSPAEKSGLQKGDIILELDGKSCNSIAEFRFNLFKHEVGETVNIKINRNGKIMDIKATLAASE